MSPLFKIGVDPVYFLDENQANDLERMFQSMLKEFHSSYPDPESNQSMLPPSYVANSFASHFKFSAKCFENCPASRTKSQDAILNTNKYFFVLPGFELYKIYLPYLRFTS